MNGWAAFWRGVASILDLSGSGYRQDDEPEDPPNPRPTDAEALASDWDKIRRDWP